MRSVWISCAQRVSGWLGAANAREQQLRRAGGGGGGGGGGGDGCARASAWGCGRKWRRQPRRCAHSHPRTRTRSCARTHACASRMCTRSRTHPLARARTRTHALVGISVRQLSAETALDSEARREIHISAARLPFLCFASGDRVVAINGVSLEARNFSARPLLQFAMEQLEKARI
eukprot:6180713-Pleurochrysis_carterae.AAC.1